MLERRAVHAVAIRAAGIGPVLKLIDHHALEDISLGQR